MTILVSRLREISTFIYILIFLLIFNLIFNLNNSWYGISLIVRIYIFIFSFYLIFEFASLNLHELKEEYKRLYGRKGEFILFLETRVIPFLLIYLITILFTLVDYIREYNWPWNPLLSMLNGRYSNTIIYSLLLLLILKLKKDPIVTILSFLICFIFYFFLDKFVYTASESGVSISLIKIIKMLVFFFFVFYEFFGRRLVSIFSSLFLSFIIFFSTFSSFSLVFKHSDALSFQRKESGLLLLRLGFLFPLDVLKTIVVQTSDFKLLQELLQLSKKYNIKIDYKNDEWEHLLFSGSVEIADLISYNLIEKDIDLSYDKIVAYSEKMSKVSNGKLENAENYIWLSSGYIEGNEDDLIERMRYSNKSFKLWGMSVLAENKSIDAVPLLLEFLTDIDVNISKQAYITLTKITGLDPRAESEQMINNPDLIILFKRYYLLHHRDHE